MKTLNLAISTFILSCFANVIFAQAPQMPIDSITKLITYKTKVESTLKKDILYKRGIEWVNAVFKNASDATSVRDEQNGIIEGKYRFKIYNVDKAGNKTEAGLIQFSFKIECKDNKYRYTFDKFNNKAISYSPIEKWLDKSSPSYKPSCDNYLQQVDEYTKDLIVKLKKIMSKPEGQKKDDF